MLRLVIEGVPIGKSGNSGTSKSTGSLKPVILFSKLNIVFSGCFDPVHTCFHNERRLFRGDLTDVYTCMYVSFFNTTSSTWTLATASTPWEHRYIKYFWDTLISEAFSKLNQMFF